MRLKTFTAPTISQAMDMVRQSLGEDALIISTLQDGNQYKITAALEDEESVYHNEEFYEILDFHRVEEEIQNQIKTILSSLEKSSLNLENVFFKALELVVPSLPLDLVHAKEPLYLVGLPGVGKSATLAKIGLMRLMNQAQMHAITTDIHKAGAISQIQTFSEKLNMQMELAENIATLKEKIRPYSVIDTGGINPYDSDEIYRLKSFLNAVPGKIVCVTQAGGDLEETEEILDIFCNLGAQNLIVTKVDATKRLGNLLRFSRKIPLSHCSMGANVTAGLKDCAMQTLYMILKEKVS
jgi:flagellar biosynthesis protein FlhF